MNTEERERINTLIDIALHMAQELTELVDEAMESSGDDTALSSVRICWATGRGLITVGRCCSDTGMITVEVVG